VVALAMIVLNANQRPTARTAMMTTTIAVEITPSPASATGSLRSTRARATLATAGRTYHQARLAKTLIHASDCANVRVGIGTSYRYILQWIARE